MMTNYVFMYAHTSSLACDTLGFCRTGDADLPVYRDFVSGISSAFMTAYVQVNLRAFLCLHDSLRASDTSDMNNSFVNCNACNTFLG